MLPYQELDIIPDAGRLECAMRMPTAYPIVASMSVATKTFAMIHRLVVSFNSKCLTFDILCCAFTRVVECLSTSCLDNCVEGDTVFCSIIHETLSSVQSDLNIDIANRWQMSFIPSTCSKCYVMGITRKREPIIHHYPMLGTHSRGQ